MYSTEKKLSRVVEGGWVVGSAGNNANSDPLELGLSLAKIWFNMKRLSKRWCAALERV